MKKAINKKKISKHIDIQFDDWDVFLDRKTAKISPVYSEEKYIAVNKTRTVILPKLPWLVRIFTKNTKIYTYRYNTKYVSKITGYKFQYEDKNFTSYYSNTDLDELRKMWQKLKNEIANND